MVAANSFPDAIVATAQRTENINFTVDSLGPDQLLRSQTLGLVWTLVDVTANDGRILTFKDIAPAGAGTVFVLRPVLGQTINGVVGDFAFTIPSGAITIRGDAGSSNWDVVSETAPPVPSTTLAGDVTGPSGANTVARWENQPLDAVTMGAPVVGNVPSWDGAKWIATAPSSPSPVTTFNRVEYWGGQTDGATTIMGMMNCALGRAGGSNIPQPTATSLLTQTKRAGFTVGINNSTTMGILDGTGLLTVWRGNAAGFGGFNLRYRFAFELAAGNSLHRCLVGLIAQSGSSGAQDWTTQLGIASIGVGFTQITAPSFTGNWNLIHSVGDGVTAPTVTSLGATMPINVTDLYQLDLIAQPNDTFITVTLTNLSTGAVVTTNVNANFPAPNKFLALWCANACTTQVGGSTPGQFDVIEYAFQANF